MNFDINSAKEYNDFEPNHIYQGQNVFEYNTPSSKIFIQSNLPSGHISKTHEKESPMNSKNLILIKEASTPYLLETEETFGPE